MDLWRKIGRYEKGRIKEKNKNTKQYGSPNISLNNSKSALKKNSKSELVLSIGYNQGV